VYAATEPIIMAIVAIAIRIVHLTFNYISPCRRLMLSPNNIVAVHKIQTSQYYNILYIVNEQVMNQNNP
jgi:hypothetical protein